ncbi:MAG: ABC transporter permease subunit [Acidobacteria bacterium]|nr:ABC transporter permease subunit [Acidobacteriota bacterium]
MGSFLAPPTMGESPVWPRGLSLGLRRETFFSLLLFACAWQIASYFAPPYVIPGWQAIGKSLLHLHMEWIAVTAVRVLFSLLLSFGLGALLAMLMYSSRAFERYLLPLLKMLMAVPVLCWILFAVLWFRGVEFRIAFVLVIICGPIFVIDLLDGMKGVLREWREMLRSLRPSKFQFFQKLILPAILPAVLTSWKVNLSLAVRVVTIAELVGATSGIGYGLVVAQGLFSIADIFAWTLVLVVILLVAQQIITLLEDRLLHWRESA